MREYIKRSIRAKLLELFPLEDAETALSWWIATEGRPPVVIVGAGFTRNAQDRSTGKRVAPELVPLWPDLLRRLGEDLRVDPSGIDALTIAELHEEGLGRRRHIDLLLEMMPNEVLEPGDAHHAIFDLRPAAIITTNFLDTVLDRHPRAVPVFDDAGASVRINPVEKTEVLYLHGHRSAPTTWVFTRSQYEDLEKTRPMLLTRVRQLLAHHPVLTMGYGLADPDFHQLHRQMGEQMKRCQPLGLTLDGPVSQGDRFSEREAAFRRHWERQDVRIVRFSNWSNFEGKLASFLRMPGKVNEAEIERFLLEEKSFANRKKIVRSIISDPDAEKRIDGEYGWQETLWRMCLDVDLIESEQKETKALIQQVNDVEQAAMKSRFRPTSAAEASDQMRGDARPLSSPKFSTPLLNSLEHNPLAWELARLCDCWWQSARDKSALLDWLHERIGHHDWPVDPHGKGSDVRIAELLVILVASTPPSSLSQGDRAYAGDAMLLLHRYVPSTAERLEAAFPHLRGTGKLGTRSRDPEILQAMDDGFQAALNGDHAVATGHYDRAAEHARRTADVFVFWLAAHGRWISAEVLFLSDLRDERSETQVLLRKRYRTEALESANHPNVLRWERDAEQRLLKLRKMTVEDLRKATHQRAFEGRSMRFSSVPHLAWRSLRDIEELHAHPSLQRDYLLPLLDHGFGDVAEEAKYRLTFRIDDFDRWSREAVEDGNVDRAAYDMRTEALMSAWFDVAEKKPSVSALVACLEAIPSLSQFIRREHVDRIRNVLEQAEDALKETGVVGSHGPDGVQTYSGTVEMSRVIARAWQAWLGMRGQKEDFHAFCAWAEKKDARTLLDPYDARLDQIRWEALVRAGVSPDDLVLWLASEARISWLMTGRGKMSLGHLGVALWTIAAIRPGGLATKTAWLRVVETLLRLLPAQAATSTDVSAFSRVDDIFLAAFGVLHEWEGRQTPVLLPDAEFQQVGELRTRLSEYMRVIFAPRIKTAHEGAELVDLLPVAAAALDDNFALWNEWVSVFWDRLLLSWTDVVKIVRNNFWASKGVVSFFAVVIRKAPVLQVALARKMILEVVRLSASSLGGLAGVVDEKLWDHDTWSELVNQIRVGASGARGQFPGSWRSAVCDLVRFTILRTCKPLPEELHFLLQYVCDMAANESAIVANHAAYAVAAIARYGVQPTDDEVARQLTKTLRLMATDVRPGVRAAAAYAAGGLHRTATHAVLKELSDELVGCLSEDTYAYVSREWWFGERQAEAEMKQEISKADAGAEEAG